MIKVKEAINKFIYELKFTLSCIDHELILIRVKPTPEILGLNPGCRIKIFVSVDPCL